MRAAQSARIRDGGGPPAFAPVISFGRFICTGRFSGKQERPDDVHPKVNADCAAKAHRQEREKPTTWRKQSHASDEGDDSGQCKQIREKPRWQADGAGEQRLVWGLRKSVV